MTTHPGKVTVSAEQLAQCAQVLEFLLPHGYSLTHTRGRWYLKHWDSWINRADAHPRMTWRDIDSDKDLTTLLGRLGERS